MAFIGEVAAYLKADNSDFRTKMAEGGESVEKFDKQVKKFGLGFGGVAVLATTFRAIVDYARDLVNPLDENLKRAKAFALGLDEAKQGMLELGAKALGVVNGLGEWLGKQAAIVIHGREQVALAEQIEKQTLQTLAAIEKDKKLTEEVGKIRAQIRASEEKATEEATKQLDLKTQIALQESKLQAAIDAHVAAAGDKLASAKAELAVAQERAGLEKLRADDKKKTDADEKKTAEEAEKLAERRQKIEFESLSAQQQTALLQESEAALLENIADLREQGLDTSKEEVDLLEIQRKLGKERQEQLQKKAKLAFDALSLEEKILSYQESMVTLEDLILAGKKDGIDVTFEEIALLENKAELEKLLADLKDRQNKASNEGVVTAGKLTKEMQKQLALINAQKNQGLSGLSDVQIQSFDGVYLGERRTRDDLVDESTLYLDDLVQSLQGKIEQLRAGGFGATAGAELATGRLARSLAISQLDQERFAAQQELTARRTLEDRVVRYGEEGAARSYAGNIQEFERLLQFVNPPGEAKRAADGIQELNDRLKASGLFPRT